MTTVQELKQIKERLEELKTQAFTENKGLDEQVEINGWFNEIIIKLEDIAFYMD